MHIHRIVLLLVVAILAGAHPVSTFEQPQRAIQSETTKLSTPASPSSVNGGKKIPSTPRVLRASYVQSTDQDSRTDASVHETRFAISDLSSGVSKIAHLASRLSPITPKLAFRLWLEAGTSPKILFKQLNIKQLISSGGKLDDNPTLLEWLRYAVAYKTRYPTGRSFQDGEIYLMLAKRMPEAEVATFFQSLKGRSDLKTLGETLQNTQYYAWWKTGMEPNNVEKMLGIADSTKTFNPKYSIYLGYVQVWLGNSRIVL